MRAGGIEIAREQACPVRTELINQRLGWHRLELDLGSSFARLCLPDQEQLVSSAGGNPPAVGAELGVEQWAVVVEHRFALTAGRAPAPDGAILTGGHQPVAVRTEGHAPHWLT